MFQILYMLLGNNINGVLSSRHLKTRHFRLSYGQILTLTHAFVTFLLYLGDNFNK